MAAAAALNVVKQISALAEGPPTPEMRDCLGQVVSSLTFFLEHPDSRVRINAARALVKLKSGYSDDIASLDLSRARTSLDRCIEAVECGNNDADVEELMRLLRTILGLSVPEEKKRSSESDIRFIGRSPSVRNKTSFGDTPETGEVVLKVGSPTSTVKASILKKVVALSGIVSVTFEGDFVICKTRTAESAADAGFLADLLTAVKCVDGLTGGVQLVNCGGEGCNQTPVVNIGGDNADKNQNGEVIPTVIADDEDGEDDPGYLDDDDEEEDDVSPGNQEPQRGVQLTGASAQNGANGLSNGISGAQPFGVSPNGQKQWSFFSQSNWMTANRRVQEYDDDPTIAERLAKAKQRKDEKKKEEATRIGWFQRWVGRK